MSQEKFGEQFELGSQGVVWQYLNGHIPLNLAAALKFSKGLGKPVAEFSPTLAAQIDSNVDGEALIAPIRGVSVVGTAQLGDDGYWTELEYPVGHGEGFVPYPMKDPNTYALRVKGDSMRPRIQPGEFVVIEPNHAVAAGDEVMVQSTDGRSMVKKLGSRRNGLLELLSVNEDHRPITLDESQVAKIHYVGGIIKASLYYEKT